LGRCEQEAAQWFLHRGYAVAFALRRGYGETGGQDAENVGSCQRPDFVRAGAESAIDVDAVVNYFTGNFAFIRPDSAVVVGQSAGGWASIAYDSFPHARVSAFINMAGVRGGHRDNLPNDNCRPDLLIDAAEHFGRTATTPMLWIYTKNDSFFAPQLASGLWHAFTRGGGKGDFNQLGAFSTDGHRLFFGHGGSEIWGPIVDRYLK
jgi:pimeloyl-ACP methyl ester carboxylesterase